MSLSFCCIAANRKPWSTAEKEAVLSFFRAAILQGTVPGKKQCETCLSNSHVLQETGRDWKNIKYFVYNVISSHKKKC